MGPETREDYKRLIDHIKSYGTWAKPLYSVWLVKSSKTASQIRDDLTRYVDSNDKLLVMNVTGTSWASLRLPDAVATWMKANL
jgi:hypothetical protein